ncbi:hypothetical protein IHE44_0009825 [Lamprotornis superbus]|uniref:peptide-methionine (S)-S-oxide reductase n=1 Tax=Lamprotornis superbus TaxID=245042 RepID=A0A835NKN1_9PASS|nr:hypothetical protein IHE44_0009825 [Lamprotornis superbus]
MFAVTTGCVTKTGLGHCRGFLDSGIRLDGAILNLSVAKILQHDKHHVNGNRMVEPFPEGTQMALFGMGCFWGAERKFWRQKGVYSTQVGYAGGHTPNPTYKEVCSGRTGHTEAVRVVFEPQNISFEQLLKVFWENHDPTQGMRQGNDVGTQYRSAIYTFSQEQMEAALRSKEQYQKVTLGREGVELLHLIFPCFLGKMDSVSSLPRVMLENQEFWCIFDVKSKKVFLRQPEGLKRQQIVFLPVLEQWNGCVGNILSKQFVQESLFILNAVHSIILIDTCQIIMDKNVGMAHFSVINSAALRAEKLQQSTEFTSSCGAGAAEGAECRTLKYKAKNISEHDDTSGSSEFHRALMPVFLKNLPFFFFFNLADKDKLVFFSS